MSLEGILTSLYIGYRSFIDNLKGTDGTLKTKRTLSNVDIDVAIGYTIDGRLCA